MAEKKYVIDNAELMAEWNWERNTDFDPSQLTLGSNKKVWWTCDKGHEWQAPVNNRNKGRGCPYCSGNIVLKGYNDLQTINPTLAQEWNYEKNDNLKPEDFTANSGKKLWWKCSKGHEWKAAIHDRNKGSRCPYCAGKKVLKGFNDLLTVNPIVAKQWNYEKNNGLTPVGVTPNSNKKVWWKCGKGHEWQATISSRNAGRGCPICTSERNTSFPEYAIMYYLIKYDLDVIHSYREKGYELDIYIPSRKIAIEYDGYRWHKDKTEQDLLKNSRCVKDGISLYRIREGLLPLNSSSLDFIVQRSQENLGEILKVVLSEIFKTNIDVDLNRDFVFIENLRNHTEKESSILFSNPEIAREWDYAMNGNMRPENYTANSARKVWWKCAKGHQWQAAISSRNKGHGCPYCAGLYVIEGENDLQTVSPLLTREWNYEKNINLKPENFTEKSGQKVWWKCGKGHEWQARIADRYRGRGCPYCSGRYAIKGENDLQTVNPVLAKEWNYEKNHGLTPSDVMSNSGKKVWWKCSKGHEWQATIDHRNKGTSCPICRKNKRS